MSNQERYHASEIPAAERLPQEDLGLEAIGVTE